MEHYTPSDEIKSALDTGWGVVLRKHRTTTPGGSYGPGTSDTDEIYIVLEGASQVYHGHGWETAGPGTLSFFPRRQIYGVAPGAHSDGQHKVLTFLFQAPDDWRCALGNRTVKLSPPWRRLLLALEERCEFDAHGQRVVPCQDLLRLLDNLALVESARARGAADTPHSASAAIAGDARDGLDTVSTAGTTGAASATSTGAGRQPVGRTEIKRLDTAAGWIEQWVAAEEIIQARGCDGLTVDELAEAVHVSGPTLRRIFHAACGCTPKQALTRFRIDHARRLLASGKWNVTQVAQRTGYSSVQRFSAAFHAATGESPAQFARRG
ncbi:MAG: helix-turn-helix domain-containing protein [Planctomycetota bacterium]